LLYGANALGAVAGASLSTFIMLEVFGTRLTLWIACLLNLLVAVSARAVDRGLSKAQEPPTPREATKSTAGGSDPAGAPSAASVPFVLIAAGSTGFVFLLLELVWYRMLSPLLGGSTYTFGLILAVALLGIGLGGLAYTFRGAGGPPQLSHFALSCGFEALLVAIPFALGDRLATLTLLLRGFAVVGLGGQLAAWTVTTSIVVLPAAVVAGYQFPLLIALLGRGSRQVSRHVGLAYASNTLGAILGSLAGGFVLMPLLTAPGLWKLAVWVLAVLGAGAAVLQWSATRTGGHRRQAALVIPMLTSVLALVWLHGAVGPTAVWRHSPIGAGRADHVLGDRTQNKLHQWFNERRASIAWEVDGRESSIALSISNDTSFLVTGKSDGAAVDDSATQVMGGLLGAMLHGDVRRVLVIGLGTGSTAGWLGALPSVERVDVIEIEPAIVEVARVCGPVNHGALANPKVNLIIADAREVLLTSRDRYDLIFSEPSNPYRAGIASLFTKEFYESAAARLNPDGLFIQWVQGYEIDVQSVRTVYATLATVFPSIESWRADPGDLLLISRSAEAPFDLERMGALVSQTPYREALLATWRVTTVAGVLAHFVGRPAFARAITDLAGPFAVNTDDRNLLEFGVSRSLGRPNNFDVEHLRQAASDRGEARPQLVNGQLDWQQVDDRRMLLGMASSASPRPFPLAKMSPAQQRRFEALSAWVAGNARTVVGAWGAQPRAPEGAVELMVLADAHATVGNEAAALPLVDQLRLLLPTETHAIVARLGWSLGQRDRAFEALEQAFLSYRSDPWASNMLMARSLSLALELARAERRFVEPLFVLLGEPFSVQSLTVQRSAVRFEIALLGGESQMCVQALEALEPHPIWQESFLTKRLLCYQRVGHPREPRAREDLSAFRTARGWTVATDLVPPAPAAPPASPSRR
ncbi:MAG: spermidine synthase, partial [Deltaproteobacteria bacterium]